MNAPTKIQPLNMIGLVRVSGANQALDGRQGIPRQVESVRRIAAEHGARLTIVEISDVSGSDVAQTPEWQTQILPALQAGAGLAVDSIDRLCRADGLDLTVLADVARAGASIYTPGKVSDLSRTDDVLVTGLLALLGGKEKKEIVRRALAAKEAGRRAGRLTCGKPALGCHFDKKGGTWSLTPDADKVAEAFQLYAQGTPIADLTRRYGWSRQVVQAGLSNEIYKGILVSKWKSGKALPTANGRQPRKERVKRDPAELVRVRVYGGDGQAPQIVSDDLFAAVQKRLAADGKRHTSRVATTRTQGWYSAILEPADAPDAQDDFGPGYRDLDVGSVTKHRLYVSRAPDGYRYNCHCSEPLTAAKIGRCNVGHPHADKINPAIDTYLAKLTRDPDTLAILTADADRAIMAAVKAAPDARQALEARKAANVTKRARLLDLYVDGDLDKGAYRARVSVIDADDQAIDADLAALNAQKAPPVPTAADLQALAASWAFDPAWPYEVKKAWLQRYVVSIAITRDTIDSVTLRIPTGNDGALTYVAGAGAAFADLLPPPPVVIRTGDVANALGVSRTQIAYLLRRGIVAQPAGRSGGQSKWTQAELDAAKAAYAAYAAQRGA